MNNNKVFASASPAVLPSVARKEPERSDGDRSATGGKTVPAPVLHPNPEVAALARRRRFTAEFKQRILAEADTAKDSGSVGALLRREGLYSSLLVTWRRERAAGILQGLSPQRRGPKSKRDPIAEEMQQLRRIVIDIQKKVAALLGRPIVTPDPEENL